MTVEQLQKELEDAYVAGCPGWTYCNQPGFVATNIKRFREDLENKIAELTATIEKMKSDAGWDKENLREYLAQAPI